MQFGPSHVELLGGTHPGSSDPGKQAGGEGNVVIGGSGVSAIDGVGDALGRWQAGSGEPGTQAGLGGHGSGG
ncbi:hypothetical protein [Amycolatopsis sp. lyj-346]|uniref:hypothetical protein n=1 Tax=Amycolatopsis sp. lyj-346 TaxID=2789289 RepID=UPI003979FCDF